MNMLRLSRLLTCIWPGLQGRLVPRLLLLRDAARAGGRGELRVRGQQQRGRVQVPGGEGGGQHHRPGAGLAQRGQAPGGRGDTGPISVFASINMLSIMELTFHEPFYVSRTRKAYIFCSE